MSVNPRFYKAPALPEKSKEAAAGSLTWQAGQAYRLTDSGVTPVLSDGAKISGLFAETQAVATTAGDKVWVHRITQPDQLFTFCVTDGGTDTKIGSTVVGQSFGYAVNSCIGTLSIGNASSAVLHIEGLLTDLEPYLNDTSDVPAQVVAGITAAALVV